MKSDEKDKVTKVSVSVPASLWQWVEEVAVLPGMRSQVVAAALAAYREKLSAEPSSGALYRVAEQAARYGHERKKRGLGKIKKSVQ